MPFFGLFSKRPDRFQLENSLIRHKRRMKMTWIPWSESFFWFTDCFFIEYFAGLWSEISYWGRFFRRGPTLELPQKINFLPLIRIKRWSISTLPPAFLFEHSILLHRGSNCNLLICALQCSYQSEKDGHCKRGGAPPRGSAAAAASLRRRRGGGRRRVHNGPQDVTRRRPHHEYRQALSGRSKPVIAVPFMGFPAHFLRHTQQNMRFWSCGSKPPVSTWIGRCRHCSGATLWTAQQRDRQRSTQKVAGPAPMVLASSVYLQGGEPTDCTGWGFRGGLSIRPALRSSGRPATGKRRRGRRLEADAPLQGRGTRRPQGPSVPPRRSGRRSPRARHHSRRLSRPTRRSCGRRPHAPHPLASLPAARRLSGRSSGLVSRPPPADGFGLQSRVAQLQSIQSSEEASDHPPRPTRPPRRTSDHTWEPAEAGAAACRSSTRRRFWRRPSWGPWTPARRPDRRGARPAMRWRTRLRQPQPPDWIEKPTGMFKGPSHPLTLSVM